MGNSAKRDTARLGKADRARRCAELRVMGWTYEAIAREVGYAHRANAKKAIDAYRQELPRAAVEELRDELLERSDANYAKACRALAALMGPGEPVASSATDIIDAAAKVARILKVHGELGGVIRQAPPAVVTVTTNVGPDVSKLDVEELRNLVAYQKKMGVT